MPTVKRLEAAAAVLVLLGFFAGFVAGVVLASAARRPQHVLCTSTLRIEPVGPGAWSLVCEGGR